MHDYYKKLNSKDSGRSSNIKHDNENNYFSSLADKYSKISHILYISLAVFFIATLILNAKLLTYSNFNYLLKCYFVSSKIG